MIAITYATYSYKAQQEALHKELELCGFDKIIDYDPNMLDIEFEENNLDILNQKRGAGSALWKPYFIARTLIEDSDSVLYIDCGDRIKNFSFKSFVEDIVKKQEFFIVENVHKNRHHTKRDCFTLMGCDEHEYWDSNIMEAGICAFAKTGRVLDFVFEWLDWCQVSDVIKDVRNKNLFGKYNHAGFTNHKCDQSILTNLVIKHSIPTIPIAQVLPYIDYNYRG